jgi:hypothetical protein
MCLRGLTGGFFVVGMLLVPAVAEELLPAGVINVALPEFGDQLGAGSDYGLANVEPVEVRKGRERGRQIRIVRTPQALRLSRRREARFQVRLGEVEHIYFWIESAPVMGGWGLSLSAIYPDGYRETIFGQDLVRGAEYSARVSPRALLEVRVTSKERNPGFRRRFIFTVSPIHLSPWSDSTQVSYASERGVAGP